MCETDCDTQVVCFTDNMEQDVLVGHQEMRMWELPDLKETENSVSEEVVFEHIWRKTERGLLFLNYN